MLNYLNGEPNHDIKQCGIYNNYNYDVFIRFAAGAIHENGTGHTHDHDHDHGHEHGHTHEVLDNPGKYTDRDRPVYRTDWKQVLVFSRDLTIPHSDHSLEL